MDQSALEMAKELVEAQIQAGNLTPEGTQQALVDTHIQLMTLEAKGQAGDVQRTARSTGAIDWRAPVLIGSDIV